MKLLFFFFVFSLFSPLVKGENQLKIGLAHKEYLENGMIIVVKEMPSSELVSLVAVVKGGSSDEGDYLGSGISHFVEHLLFKGTEKRGVGKIAQEVAGLGGNINAFTTYDYTAYVLSIPKEYFKEGLSILADAIMHSQFKAEEIEKERKVILKEIKLYKDIPLRYLWELFFSTAFLEHPYQHPIIGYSGLLKGVKREDLINYYRKFYVPNNLILAVAGGIDKLKVLEETKRVFGEFKLAPYILRPIYPEFEQIVPRQAEAYYSSSLSRVFLGFLGIKVSHPDLFALDVLAIILGDGESSRLYREVYNNKSLVYSIEAFNLTLRQAGFLGIICTLEKENIDESILAIEAEIEKIKEVGVSEEELEKARRKVLADYIFSREDSLGVARDLAINEAIMGDYNFSLGYIEGIKRVKSKDIARVAKKYLTKERLTLVRLSPPEEKKEYDPESEKIIGNIERIVLKNGLTLLLKVDRTSPTVSLQAVWRGGLRIEQEENNGIVNFTTRLILKGTEDYTSEDVAEKLESLGARIEAFSGNNSMGLSLHILSEDIDEVIPFLAEIINRPAFREEDVKKEREYILAGIKSREDSVFRVAFLALRKELFKNHPYRFDYLGEEQSIKNITSQDIAQFYQKFFTPSNMVLAIFGDIDREKVISYIENFFSSLSPQELPETQELPEAQELPESGRKEIVLSTDKKQAIIVLGTKGIKLKDKRRYSLEVLNAYLASTSGKLYKKIREDQGEAYVLGGGVIPGIDTGLFYIYVATSLSNLERVKKVILNDIDKLRKIKIKESDLSLIKNQLIGADKKSRETNLSLSLTSVLSELYGLGYDNYKVYSDRIKEVSPDDIREVAQTYLGPEKQVLVILKPEK